MLQTLVAAELSNEEYLPALSICLLIGSVSAAPRRLSPRLNCWQGSIQAFSHHKWGEMEKQGKELKERLEHLFQKEGLSWWKH